MAFGRKPSSQLELDQRDDRQLVLADEIMRSRAGSADRLPQGEQQVDWNVRAGAHLGEGLVGQR